MTKAARAVWEKARNEFEDAIVDGKARAGWENVVIPFLYPTSGEDDSAAAKPEQGTSGAVAPVTLTPTAANVPEPGQPPPRCGECDPSFGCFSGAVPCQKQPPPTFEEWHKREDNCGFDMGNAALNCPERRACCDGATRFANKFRMAWFAGKTCREVYEIETAGPKPHPETTPRGDGIGSGSTGNPAGDARCPPTQSGHAGNALPVHPAPAVVSSSASSAPEAGGAHCSAGDHNVAVGAHLLGGVCIGCWRDQARIMADRANAAQQRCHDLRARVAELERETEEANLRVKDMEVAAGEARGRAANAEAELARAREAKEPRCVAENGSSGIRCDLIHGHSGEHVSEQIGGLCAWQNRTARTDASIAPDAVAEALRQARKFARQERLGSAIDHAIDAIEALAKDVR